MNAAANRAVSRLGTVHYVGPVNPPVGLADKVLSKAVRMAGGRGRFFFFSPERLAAIADEVRSKCRPDASLDFFHGFTPWVRLSPSRPYVAWSDCTFADYVTIYHRPNRFTPSDLARIEAEEARWLRSAERVMFTSEWARLRAIDRYGLTPDKVSSVGIFGEVEAPLLDSYEEGAAFAFVSTNFTAKGGPTVLDAFAAVRTRHPDATLSIVGDAPPGPLPGGVEHCGFLRKEEPAERERFRGILSRARAVVHPTQSDISPLLLVEAAYFGCPVISSRRFAIPELVEDGRTGILLDEPGSAAAVADAMNEMLESGPRYLAMRRESWSRARTLHSREHFEEKLTDGVRAAYANGPKATA